jgi:AcrR family transcriptional regulator
MTRETSTFPRRIGRPRSFDRDEVMERIVDLFDRHGYEGLSVADLAIELQLSHPSLYAAFGPKPVLYRMALDAYAERWTAAARDTLSHTDLDVALQAFLRAQTHGDRNDGRRRGCMLTAALQTSAEDHAPEARHAVALRAKMARPIRERLERAVRDGQLPARSDLKALATCLTGLVHGLSTLARDGVPLSVLERLADGGLYGLREQARAEGAPVSARADRQDAASRFDRSHDFGSYRGLRPAKVDARGDVAMA